MRMIKKINNNVAVCLDGDNNELVAFGKGIGFPKMPYELTDLSKISMTFYKLDTHYFQLLTEIPEEIFEVSAAIVEKARQVIKRELNPNIIFSLADHINFAIIRIKKYKSMTLIFSYDIEQLYPVETQIGRYALKLIQQKLNVELPEAEITTIAMHFVNSQSVGNTISAPDQAELLIEQAVELIERRFDLKVDRKSFTYNRFAMHLRYYIKRIQRNEPVVAEDVKSLFDVMKEQSPNVYSCATDISFSIDQALKAKSTKAEEFYLMIYIKRIIDNSRTQDIEGGHNHD